MNTNNKNPNNKQDYLNILRKIDKNLTLIYLGKSLVSNLVNSNIISLSAIAKFSIFN